MADPFESLHHDVESTGSTAIDPQFRAELLAEARSRLSATSTDSIRPRVAADTPTPTQMEPITMLAKQPRKTRPILLAAACIALVAAGAIAVAVLRGDDDKRPATTDSTPPQTQPTAPPMTQETSPSAPESTAVHDDTISAVDPAITNTMPGNMQSNTITLSTTRPPNRAP